MDDKIKWFGRYLGCKVLDEDEELFTKIHRINSMDDLDFKTVDFLRSKGYAIGIPKEYYITQ